jgi:hypothetical protein
LLREQGKLPEDNPNATGFELNLSAGYQFWLGNGPWKSKGGPALRLGLGVRYPWPLSFGLSLLDLSADFGRPGANAIVTIAPGVYLRGHTQAKKQPMAVDVWGGAGFAPFAFGIAAFDSKATQAERLAGTTATEAKQAVAQSLGVNQVITQQSMNVPLELGVTLYLTRGVGLTLNGAFTFWIPSQLCYHDNSDRYCVEKGLKVQKSLFVGGGLSFLP